MNSLHERMQNADCDFWGICESHARQRHLQSFYLVVREKALSSPAFKNFWDFVPQSRQRNKAIQCELNFGLWLAEHGLKAGACLPADVMISPKLNASHAYWRFCLDKWQLGFIKRDLLTAKKRVRDVSGWQKLLLKHGYPVELITNYLRKLS